mmetsp:Transcript_36013/g.76837  ORF Transcript_36013/g.76837 Transcript_36013/m.76837 type:complete len:92 (-) Transcript_36013:13-288(-)
MTESPTGTPTSSPTKIPRLSCPFVPIGRCSICGSGKCVTKPNALLTSPQFPPTTCGNLQQLGINGQINQFQCSLLPALIGVCGCKEEGTII